MKGIIINEDLWRLIEIMNPEECQQLLSGLAAFHRGEETPGMSRVARVAYERIVLDNGRFSPEMREKRAESGRKGAEARWGKMANDSIENSKNSKKCGLPLRKEEKRKEENRGEEKRKEKFLPPFNSEAFQEAWDDFKHHRRRLKKPMTEYTEELTMKKLMKLSDSNEAKSIKILRQSIAEGWIGIFELKKEARQEEPKKERRVDYDAALIEHYIRTNGGKDEVREHQNRG